MPDDFWGIHARDFVMGMQGGIANVLAFYKLKFYKLKLVDVFSIVIVGGLTANYLGAIIGESVGQLIGRYLGVIVRPETSHDLGVYLAGLGAGTICKGIVDMVGARFRPQKAEKK